MVKKNAQELIPIQDSSDLRNLTEDKSGLIPLVVSIEDDEPIEVHEDGSLESSDEPKVEEIIFTMDAVPGAPDAKEVTVDEDVTDKVVIEEEGSPETDSWKWEHQTFLKWLMNMINGVPKHSGHATTGLEKAISYFEALDREITKAMRTDYKNEIDAAKAEEAREQIEKGLDALVERLEKVRSSKYKRHAKKSRGEVEDEGMVKEAQRAIPVNGITITVPLLISRIARVCINGVVSAGHDLEDMFTKQCKEYNLDKREQAELEQLLSDMNYPIYFDRGVPRDKPVDKTRSDNFDWAANYRS